ncbi:MAG: MobA/MobL family protein [Clostridia bacterium]|nr:MobA/MobL family protein [Clostridia bacterium]
MAFLFMQAKIVKASSGRSAVAAAAYQAAQKLKDDSLGMTFQYWNKEEVIFSEILLPSHAPAAYADRETLWNAVQEKENHANSQVARAFIIAMPKEWTREESISRAREFIQKNLVDAGMVADWAFHMKDGNPHLHCLCTIRGFKEDGTWDAREKKVYALDENGQRIPEIDPKTGEQKIRTRNRNGSIVTEKIWKRNTVQSNPWNSRQFLHELKRSWVSYCNSYLQGESQIDNRSTHEQESNRVPLLHEGPEARAALERGIVFDVIKENQERRRINAALARMEQLIRDARKLLDELREKFIKWRESHGQKRSVTAHDLIRRNGGIAGAVPGANPRNAAGAGADSPYQRIKEITAQLEQRTQQIRSNRPRH